jgi:hypothetical protein
MGWASLPARSAKMKAGAFLERQLIERPVENRNQPRVL